MAHGTTQRSFAAGMAAGGAVFLLGMLLGGAGPAQQDGWGNWRGRGDRPAAHDHGTSDYREGVFDVLAQLVAQSPPLPGETIAPPAHAALDRRQHRAQTSPPNHQHVAGDSRKFDGYPRRRLVLTQARTGYWRRHPHHASKAASARGNNTLFSLCTC